MRIVVLLAIVLVGWMIGGTWFWTCKVKQLCGNPLPTTAQQTDAGQTLGGASSDNAQSAAQLAAEDQRRAAAEEAQRQEALRLAEEAAQLKAAKEAEERARLQAIADNSVSGQLLLREPVQAWISGPVPVNFMRGGAQLTSDQGLDRALQSIAEQIKLSPGTLQVTGGFFADEPGSDNAMNPGLLRAHAVVQRLQALGVGEDRLLTSYAVFPADSKEDVELLSLELLPASDDSLPEDLRARFTSGAAVYFEVGKSYVRLDDETRRALSALIQFLNKQPQQGLALIGHTDNTGNAEANIKLGLQRAESTASFLKAFGLRNPNLVVSSKGGAAPVADNATDEGRARNRRVEIRLVPVTKAPPAQALELNTAPSLTALATEKS